MLKRFGIIPIGVVIFLILGASSCSSTNAPNATQHNQQIEANQEQLYNVNQPIPVFPFSQYRQTLIDIETFQAEGGPSTSFMMPNNWAPGEHPFYQCPSLGMPVASTSQLSNPSKVINSYDNGVASAVIPQIDPSGIYSGNSTGTYTLCLNTAGQKYAAYWEGYTLTLAGNAAWNAQTGSISDVTNVTGTFNTLTPDQQKQVNEAAISAYQNSSKSTSPTTAPAPPKG